MLRSEHTTLAIRITRRQAARALIQRCGLSLLSTSPHPPARPAARSAVRVRQYFHDSIDYLLPGQLGSARGPSEIRHLQDGAVQRARP